MFQPVSEIPVQVGKEQHDGLRICQRGPDGNKGTGQCKEKEISAFRRVKEHPQIDKRGDQQRDDRQTDSQQLLLRHGFNQI